LPSEPFARQRAITALEREILTNARSADDRVALAAVGEINDQTTLKWIARDSKSKSVRLAAIAKLTDHEALEFVAYYTTAEDEKIAAIRRIYEDHAIIALVSRESELLYQPIGNRSREPDLVILTTAMAMLREMAQAEDASQWVLRCLALHSNDASEKLAAVRRISNTMVLDSLIRSGDREIRAAAYRQILDSSVVPKPVADILLHTLELYADPETQYFAMRLRAVRNPTPVLGLI
jgi:hypothetical protein